MLEPEAAAIAALRVDQDVLADLRRELDRMVAAEDRADDLIEADTAFHDVIARAPGNGVLRALLRSLSTKTVRARLWHGLVDRDALDLARAEHRHIYDAIAAGDADLARAATLLHIAHNETWLRDHLGPADDVPSQATAESRRSGVRPSSARAVTAGTRCGPLGGLFAVLDDDAARATVDRAWELGVRLFDTAPLYGSGLSEERLGQALRGRPRGEYELSTKVDPPCCAPELDRSSTARPLVRLRLQRRGAC